MPNEIQPGLSGHIDIAENQVTDVFRHQNPGLSGIFRRPAGIPVGFQDLLQQHPDRALVIDDQDLLSLLIVLWTQSGIFLGNIVTRNFLCFFNTIAMLVHELNPLLPYLSADGGKSLRISAELFTGPDGPLR
jgi:hypothetical protein